MIGNDTILVVEDDTVQMRQVVRLLKAEGYSLSQASSGEEAVRILDEMTVNLVLTDRKMPAMDGDSLLDYVRTNHPGTPVAIITAYPEGVEGLKPDGLLEKPFRWHQLKELVERLIGNPPGTPLQNRETKSGFPVS